MSTWKRAASLVSGKAMDLLSEAEHALDDAISSRGDSSTPRGQAFAALNDADKSVLERLRRLAHEVPRALYEDADFHGRREDLALVQRIVDEKVFDPADGTGHMALGVVLGDVLAAETGAQWMSVIRGEDSFPALKRPGGGRPADPVHAVLRPAEKGTSVVITDIYNELISRLRGS